MAYNNYAKKIKFKNIPLTVGICAHNEEQNITKSIKSAFKQMLPENYYLSEFLVVASGCTDNTIPRVNTLIKKYPKIRLIIEKQRLGKASAVNNLIKYSKNRIIILQGADILLANKCYFYLLSHISQKDVGMVGGKIIPLDDKSTFLGYINHLKWELHHKISIKYPERPKLGELILFKKIFTQIPPTTAVDEASIEPLIKLQGYRTVYEPNAVIYNKGPKTIREYLSQRRRIFAGHYENKLKYGYEVITFSSFAIIPIFLSSIKWNIKDIFYFSAMAVLELISRTAGFFDIKFRLRSHTVWKPITTSKSL